MIVQTALRVVLVLCLGWLVFRAATWAVAYFEPDCPPGFLPLWDGPHFQWVCVRGIVP